MKRPATRLVSLAAVVCVAACTQRVPTLDKLTPGIFLEPRPRPTIPLRPVSDKGLDLTKSSEGFVATLYHDVAGYCTIAYGHLVNRGPCTDGNSAEFGAGVTEVRGSELLVQDMASAQLVVMNAIPSWRDLTDGQFSALCDFVYNVGGGAFRSSTLLKRILEGKHTEVPAQMRRWILADGKPWAGLIVRREAEIQLYFDGQPIPRSVPAPSDSLDPLNVGMPEA